VIPSFWAGKQVLVTGHTGFKGAWLCLLLERLGARVTGYAIDPPSTPSLFGLARIADRIDHVHGDVRDFERLFRVVRERRPEIVLHMAAQALVRKSYRDPIETYATNVMGTVHVLEAVRQAGCVRAVVNVTSDKCYHNREVIWGYRETDRMGGHDPYSNSKGCAELVADAFRDSYFKPQEGGDPNEGTLLSSCRAGNVIGGGDWAEDRLIPDMIRACSQGKPVYIRNPHAIRPWQHVLEPLAGYLSVAEKMWTDGREFAGGWNFGPAESDAQPVQRIVDRIVDLWGEGASWELSPGPHPHEAHYLKLDCTKARTKLGWSPRTDLATALEWIVDWYKRVGAGGDARQITLETVDQFLSLEPAGQWIRTPSKHRAADSAKAA
jgi:CDP-glucose 4,6-dehydratase